MMKLLIPLAIAALVLTGCNQTTTPEPDPVTGGNLPGQGEAWDPAKHGDFKIWCFNNRGTLEVDGSATPQRSKCTLSDGETTEYTAPY
jgi:hypothetical protein